MTSINCHFPIGAQHALVREKFDAFII